MTQLSIKDRMIRSVALRAGEVVLRSDYAHMGSASQVSRALKEVVAAGKLVRVGYGVYAKAQPSVLTGEPIPRQPLEAIAFEALQRLRVDVTLGQAQQDYAASTTTQIPMRTSFNTGQRRISRKLAVGKRTVSYENNY